MISLLQNFVVTKQDRLNTLKETLPDIAKYFKRGDDVFEKIEKHSPLFLPCGLN